MKKMYFIEWFYNNNKIISCELVIAIIYDNTIKQKINSYTVIKANSVVKKE